MAEVWMEEEGVYLTSQGAAILRPKKYLMNQHTHHLRACRDRGWGAKKMRMAPRISTTKGGYKGVEQSAATEG